MIEKREAAVIGLFACLPLVTFLLFGYNGSDSMFHYSSWMGYSDSFRQGDFFPGWDQGANYGLGSPRFYFYPPLSFLLGGMIGLIFPVNLIGLVFSWLCLLIAGLSMYILSSLFVKRREQLLVALLYMTSYHFIFVIFTKFATAHVLVNSLLPLVVYSFFKLMLEVKRMHFVGLTLLLAMSWITDVPMSIATAYVLGATAILVTIRERDIKPLLLYGLSQAIAIIVSFWYLIPAFLASKNIASTDYLYYGYLPSFVFPFEILSSINSDTLIHFMLFVCTVIGFAAFVYFNIRKRKKISTNRYWALMMVIGVISFILQMPGTRFIWEFLPMFKIIGFNARFHVFLAIIISLIAVAVTQGRQRYLVYSCWTLFFLAILAGAAVLSYKAKARGDDFVVYQATGLQELHASHPGVLEYLQPEVAKALADDSGIVAIYQGVKEQARAFTQPVITQPSSCQVNVIEWEAATKRLAIDSPEPCTITLRHYYFPFWNVYIDGQPARLDKTAEGLMTFNVSAGQHEAQALFQTPGRNQWIGLAGFLTGAAILIITLTVLWPHVGKASYRYNQTS